MTTLAVAQRVVLLWGWKRATVALAAGASTALAFQPFGLWPVLLIAYPTLILLLDGAPDWRGAAATGWCFGFGALVGGLWWIGSAFLVEDRFVWLLPFGVAALPAGLAIFHALGAVLARILWSAAPWRIFALASGLGISEWLRGHVLTGFPWNVPGQVIADLPPLDQTASLIGVEGLSFVAVALFAAPVVLIDGTRRGRAATLIAALVAAAAMGGYGAWRLAGAPPAGNGEGLAVRILQPDLPQDAKFRPERGGEVLDLYTTLSMRATSPERPGLEGVPLLVWPESAFPFLLARHDEALARLGAFLPDGTVLATGAARPADRQDGTSAYMNAIQVLADDGAIEASHDKIHLVPFGEYLPLRPWLEALGVTEFVAVPGGFTPGEQRRNMALPGGLKAAPLICYEAIFPSEVPGTPERPDLLLNVTNDGWFGDTPGPRQHFAMARTRAIEQGLPLVRAANTGISGVVDGYGRVIASLPVGARDVLDARVPPALAPTPFSRFGAYLLPLLCLLFIGGARIGRRV